MNLLFDLDCLAKLHACSAFDDALSLFPSENRKLMIVDSFPFSAKTFAKKHEKTKKHLASVFSKIADRSLIADFDELKALPSDADALDQLSKIQKVDSGEAILLLEVSRQTDALLLTGDKNFLTAVAENENLIKQIIPNFNKKFVFFLNIVCEICNRDQCKISVFSAANALESDKALIAIFGGKPTLESVRDAIASYTRNIHHICHSFDEQPQNN